MLNSHPAGLRADQGVDSRVYALHIVVLVLCSIVNVLDGFDLMSIAFTAVPIMAEWQVDPRAMGVIFGSGLAGVGLGSLVLASLADRFGRKPTIVCGLVLVTGGMLCVAGAHAPGQLGLLRFMTGLGIGLLLPSINTMVSEYAPPPWRGLAISLYASGYPLGAMLSSALAPFLIAHSGWRSVYVCGAAASLLLIPIVIAFLPESIEFLLGLQPAGAAERINKIRHGLGQPTLASLPPPAVRVATPSPWSPFKAGHGLRTCLIASGFFLLWLTSFFVTNWLPAIVTREGFAQAAAIAGILLTSGGLFGSVTFGLLAIRFNVAVLSAWYLAASCIVTLAFGSSSLAMPALLPLAALLGIFLYGAAVGLYSLAAQIFPLDVRAAGTGFALAVGRLGAVLGLSAGGWLIGMGLARSAYVSLMALPVLAAAPLIYSLRSAIAGSSATPDRLQ